VEPVQLFDQYEEIEIASLKTILIIALSNSKESHILLVSMKKREFGGQTTMLGNICSTTQKSAMKQKMCS
jgi:hypothetical protein